MSISKSCNNCIHFGINKNCLRYPPNKVASKEHTWENPDESDGNVILWQEACGEHKTDWDEINRILGKWDKQITKERIALKKEIERLGGNPRKLGAI